MREGEALLSRARSRQEGGEQLGPLSSALGFRFTFEVLDFVNTRRMFLNRISNSMFSENYTAEQITQQCGCESLHPLLVAQGWAVRVLSDSLTHTI